MPYWVIHNPTKSLVSLPSPLQGSVPPGRNVTIETQAVNIDTPGMQALIKKGLLRVDVVVESQKQDNKIEVPVVDFMRTALRWRGTWDVATAYAEFEVVKYGSTSWVALQPSIGVTPVSGPFWTPIATPSGGGSIDLKIGAELSNVGTRLWATPEPYVHVPGGMTIEVFHNTGRRLKQAASDDPRLGDYIVVESGGTGTGFDQVKLTTGSVLGLVANYQIA